MKEEQFSIDLIKQEKQEQKIKENVSILNKIISSGVSYININRVSFKRKSCCFGSKEKDTKCLSLIAYVKKGSIHLDKNASKVSIPEANYYEYEEILNNEEFTRGGNLINSFPYALYNVLRGESMQTEDWHLFYHIGGFSGPGGIGATKEHSSLYVFSGYEKFKKLEKICKELMEKEPEFLTNIKHTDDMGSYEEEKSNPWKHRPDNMEVCSKMPWPMVKELHFLAGLSGPLPLPNISKVRNLININKRDEIYQI